MSDESEEACLVNPRSPSIAGNLANVMPYTDGIQAGGSCGGGGGGGGGINSILTTNHQQSQQHQQQNSRTGRGSQQSHESETGELIDYNDEILLSQFHSDAIKQTGCGKFQLIAALITGMALAGHAIQVYAVFYIMPSAEVEFCILDNEKNWLANITLLGLGVGAFIWGGLASRTGRRKTLLSCLGVSGVFSVIAAFMPTYGPFMMARFCAAAGIGGALPAASCYLSELTPINGRSRILSILGMCGVAGGILAGGIALLTVPLTGQLVMLENKEHFSAWHRYLLLITIPTFGSILGLFWLPESPRYLLESGREVEALAIYQKIYRNNRTRGGYALTELELPGARAHHHRNTPPASVLAGMAHSINMYCGTYIQCGNKKYLRTTMLLLISWILAIFVFHGYTTYITEHSKNVDRIDYAKETITKFNVTYENFNFNISMDNMVFNQCKFFNCTFRRIFLSHVHFNNCTFEVSEFANVKTSRTVFTDTILDDIRLIDTDLTERHFINCQTNNTKIIRLLGSCDRDFEYNIFFDSLWKVNMGALIPSILAVGIIGEIIQRFGRHRMATCCFLLSMIFSVIFGVTTNEISLIWIGGTAQGMILAGLAALTIISIETYTTPLRCTALGMFVCGGHLGALLSVPIYSALPLATTKFAAGISTTTLLIPLISSFTLNEPCLLL